MPGSERVEITGPYGDRYDEILTSQAIDLIAALHAELAPRRFEALAGRRRRQAELSRGAMLDFLPDTAYIREDASWRVAPLAPGLVDRRVEITGPVDRKMIINALNSGASVFMADFEDSNSPTWENCIEGQRNLCDAVRRTIEFTSPEGKEYKLNPNPAVLFVRPRGWHLNEKHFLVNGTPISASLFDLGLFFFHNAKAQIERGALAAADGDHIGHHLVGHIDFSRAEEIALVPLLLFVLDVVLSVLFGAVVPVRPHLL